MPGHSDKPDTSSKYPQWKSPPKRQFLIRERTEKIFPNFEKSNELYILTNSKLVTQAVAVLNQDLFSILVVCQSSDYTCSSS